MKCTFGSWTLDWLLQYGEMLMQEYCDCLLLSQYLKACPSVEEAATVVLEAISAFSWPLWVSWGAGPESLSYSPILILVLSISRLLWRLALPDLPEFLHGGHGDVTARAVSAPAADPTPVEPLLPGGVPAWPGTH